VSCGSIATLPASAPERQIHCLTRQYNFVIIAKNACGQHLRGFLESDMKKEKLIEKIKEILKTDIDLTYLSVLKQEDLENLIACIRYRVDQKD
jgi:hypothetical protein